MDTDITEFVYENAEDVTNFIRKDNKDTIETDLIILGVDVFSGLDNFAKWLDSEVQGFDFKRPIDLINSGYEDDRLYVHKILSGLRLGD